MDVDVSGPFFDGRADDAVEELCIDIRSDLATQGLVGVMSVLAAPHPVGIRERTPFYETRLNISGDPTSDKTVVVNDDDVIYGPWLEGIGSRNWPVTRFKGYAAFRKAYGRLIERLPVTLDQLAKHHIRKMQ